MRAIEEKKRTGRERKAAQMAIGQRAFEKLLAEYAAADDDTKVLTDA